MFEEFGFEELTPLAASVLLGLALGLAYGVLAQRSAFCLRRSLVGRWRDCLPALGAWAMALACAIAGTRLAVAIGLISFEEHRFLAVDLPLASVLVGGALFGAGMVLTGGCASRLTVLVGTGNLRALLVLVVFAVVALAAMKGALAPLRLALGAASIPGGGASLADLPGGEIWPLALALALAVLALRSTTPLSHLAMAGAIGLLVPLGWVGTGFLLLDDFDPIPVQSMGFTGPMADTLFWTVAATSIPAGFGTGLAAGVLAGSLAAALAAGEFRWQSLEGPRQTGRYLAGAAMMGVGGVLAGGCTVGAGLSGVSTASLAALLALAAMAGAARATGVALERR
ncbi:MAG: YeeE/YedE thiosulfate transporter family protein [Defluviicoccus sp.]|nr:YeeE/YedE thiosulfate transporter family protein [Defluviicoccus sp.]MDE0384835.1 YeeE/YedE thiosulfate transporter family protein [Defluviicoccus sp.]